MVPLLPGCGLGLAGELGLELQRSPCARPSDAAQQTVPLPSWEPLHGSDRGGKRFPLLFPFLSGFFILIVVLFFYSLLNDNSIKPAHLEMSGPFLISHQSARLVLTDALQPCWGI